MKFCDGLKSKAYSDECNDQFNKIITKFNFSVASEIIRDRKVTKYFITNIVTIIFILFIVTNFGTELFLTK